MSDDLTPSQQAAAFHGLAINRSTPPSERLECALTALNLYETVTEKLHDAATRGVHSMAVVVAERNEALAEIERLRRVVQRVADHAAAEDRTHRWISDELVDALQPTEGAQPP